MKISLNIPSPIEVVNHPLLKEKGVNLFVKREDRIHPLISGNKWRKLKYNLEKAQTEKIDTMVTFGGAFSNHIHATSAACHAYGLQSIGIIRGEFDEANPTLIHARNCGMKLIFIDRASYREKEKSKKVKEILSDLDNYLLVPEGGSNDLAMKGLEELAAEINKENHQVILVSAGTGCTSAGIVNGLIEDKKAWVFPSLKDKYLQDVILNEVDLQKHSNVEFHTDYHFGGYGKSPQELITFINGFTDETGIRVDPIYNGKLIYGFLDMVKKGVVDPSVTYLWVHTGGLQGIEAYNYMAQKKNKVLIKN